MYEADPLDKAVPPEAAAYQSMATPAPAVAEIVTAPFPQREALTAVGAVGSALTVTFV